MTGKRAQAKSKSLASLRRNKTKKSLLPIEYLNDARHIERLFQKALHYQTIDPDVALIQARRTAECLSRSLYNFYNSKNSNIRPSYSFSFDTLIHELKKQKKLPLTIEVHLRSIQGFGNLAAHLEEDIPIGEDDVNSCIHSLTAVVHWGFKKFGLDDLIVPPDPNDHAMARKAWIGSIDNIEDVYKESVAITDREIKKGEKVEINLISLDMYGRDQKITDTLDVHCSDWKNIKLRALILDPKSKMLASHCGEYTTLERAQQSQKHFANYQLKRGKELAERNIDLEIRTYDCLPMFTGVSINRDYAFFALTRMIDNQLRADNYAAYHAMIASGSDSREDYCIGAFVYWFEFLWQNAKK